MKNFFKLLGIIAVSALSHDLQAQKLPSGWAPFSPGTQPFTEKVKYQLDLSPGTPLHKAPQSKFWNHLPSGVPGENRNVIIDNSYTDPQYYYNMPVIRPGKTSKILVAALDPNAPYNYNMPIKKNGVPEK